MKIIFLDIDGVLNVIGQGHDRFGQIWHIEFINNLKWIIEETGAKLVISSTWRHSGLSIMKEMWIERNLPGDVIGITIDLGTYQDDNGFYQSEPRGKEIEHYLKSHPEITNYVILDDDTDMLPNQLGNFVQTSTNINHPDCVDIGYGLTKICSEKAIRILNKVK
jgi:hypothetical protein